MNFAAELFLTACGMIFFIVIVAEILSMLLRRIGGDK